MYIYIYIGMYTYAYMHSSIHVIKCQQLMISTNRKHTCVIIMNVFVFPGRQRTFATWTPPTTTGVVAHAAGAAGVAAVGVAAGSEVAKTAATMTQVVVVRKLC